MPLYDYVCPKCQRNFERLVKDKDEVIVCECGSIATRQMPNTLNFELKGLGWFKDGYARNPNKKGVSK